jgi:hypothetical protein
MLSTPARHLGRIGRPVVDPFGKEEAMFGNLPVWPQIVTAFVAMIFAGLSIASAVGPSPLA